MLNRRIVIVLLATTLLCGCGKKDDLQVDKTNDETKSVFSFLPKQSKKVPEIKPPTSDTQDVSLYIDGSDFITLKLPSYVEYVTDFSKYIYAEDSSIAISIISNVDDKTFSSSAAIHDAESASKNLLKSKDGTKGAQEAALFLPDSKKAVILRVYEDSVAFATTYESLAETTVYEYEYPSFVLPEDFEQAEVIPSISGEPDSYVLTPGRTSMVKTFIFDDGSIILSEEFKRYEDAVAIAAQKAMIGSGLITPTVLYNDGTKMYAEIGNFTVGVVNINYNTQHVLIGRGNTAKYNISTYEVN